MRREFILSMLVLIALQGGAGYFYPEAWWGLVGLVPVLMIGFYDFFQTSHTITRNYPLLGRFRYLLESIRPEIHQYFVESNSGGTPFSREQRSVVYQRSKGELDTLPFGTQMDVNQSGYEWVNHSLSPTHLGGDDMRVIIGGPDCKQPYSSSLLNISAMSYGALSKNAQLALNGAARDGGFAHNTGEGGLSPYHLQPGGDLVWQVGTGYFGCRTPEGKFNEETFAKSAAGPTVKMVEIKLSQGAKPGHGGILPAKKLTREIAEIRNVPMGHDVLSPPAHSTFTTPVGLLEFVKNLRELSGGKPVGFKLCVGKRREFLAICKAMEKTGILPDFITVDGAEGGTGAAPLEFSNHIGSPGTEALIFVHNAIKGFGMRSHIRIINSGKVTTGFGIIRRIALGADLVNSARAMMMALGCIQALKCNSNECPTGVATQNPRLMAGLVVKDKRARVANFHGATIESVAEMLGSMGLNNTDGLRPWHIMRRINGGDIRHYGELCEYLEEGALLQEPFPPSHARALQAASPDTFSHKDDVKSAAASG